MKRPSGGDGAGGWALDNGGSSGQAKRWVTKRAHSLAVSSWP